ncbi:MAG TPA: alpha/beta fold hydrolase [Cyclobacteriaceae bacterium]|nr:alpha/beta fold hydrolase [Cyclobacteriaceae bacterium]
MKIVPVVALLVLGCSGTAQTLQEIVRFANEDDTLEGSLFVPAGVSRAPLVVFVHGSGMRTREDYNDVAEKLHAAGYATFQYDKRGVGNSGGTFREVGTYNSPERIPLLASDAVAAIKTLSKHKRINDKNIIVMGGSQAGWIIPVVASMADVSCTVLISGPTVSVGEEIYYSELAENKTHTQAEADKMFKDFSGERGFDNIEYVKKMFNASLWIFGGKDVSIPVNECIARLEYTKNNFRLPIEVRIYPDADHGIYNESRNQREDYIPFVVEWLNQHIQ